ncbi:hypothetical protein Tco_1079182 [Tanacetum coccineum]|uniref:Retrovirus-related Pol polyprotein from transposon TNT 1-94 n=1 Tax=Tanacetum coccineum TaxID=301880 RepID=A0ABQ5HSM4_9ASTR
MVAQFIPQLTIMTLSGSEEVKLFKLRKLNHQMLIDLKFPLRGGFQSKTNHLTYLCSVTVGSLSGPKVVFGDDSTCTTKGYGSIKCNDEEDVSSDDNEMVKVKVLMALADNKNVAAGKESAKNSEWVKISMRKVHTLFEMEDNDERKTFINYLCIELNYVKEQRNNLVLKHRDLIQELKTCKENLILPPESLLKVTDSLVIVTDSSVTDYDSADESLVCSTPLLPLKKLAGAEPVYGPKTIKLVLKSNSTFKAETLKGVTINEPTPTPAKSKKNVSASKKNSTPTGKLKNVKTKDDIPFYDNDTKGHNRSMSLRRGIKPRNPQHVTKICEIFGSTIHTTTDHNDIEWFRRGEALQAKIAESSNANRSKTPTKSFHSASESSMVKNKGLVAEAYDWDKEDVLSDDNEMVEVKVLMALADDKNVVVGKESARNSECVKISMRKCISEQIPNQKKRILGVDQLAEDPSSSRQTNLVFVKSSADDTNVSILSVKRPWLYEAKVIATDSSVTDYDSIYESSVCSTPLLLLEKLAGAEPVSRPKIMKSILKSNFTFKAETLKGVTINEPTSALAKGNKNVSASKNNSAPTGKLKNGKTKDDIPLRGEALQAKKAESSNANRSKTHTKSFHSTSKSSMVKNKGLVAEVYEWDEKDVSSDDNEMVEVKVLMALADDKNVAVGKESARNSE